MNDKWLFMARCVDWRGVWITRNVWEDILQAWWLHVGLRLQLRRWHPVFSARRDLQTTLLKTLYCCCKRSRKKRRKVFCRAQHRCNLQARFQPIEGDCKNKAMAQASQVQATSREWIAKDTWVCSVLWVSTADEANSRPRLNLVIVRMANVYGEYCSKLVGTMLCMARVYKELDREMKWLWTSDLKTNTVHVKDVARALWHVSEWYVGGKANWDESAMGQIPLFNIVDQGDTSQSTLLPSSSISRLTISQTKEYYPN